MQPTESEIDLPGMGERAINGRAGLDGALSVYCQMYYVHLEFLGLEA